MRAYRARLKARPGERSERSTFVPPIERTNVPDIPNVTERTPERSPPELARTSVPPKVVGPELPYESVEAPPEMFAEPAQEGPARDPGTTRQGIGGESCYVCGDGPFALVDYKKHMVRTHGCKLVSPNGWWGDWENGYIRPSQSTVEEIARKPKASKVEATPAPKEPNPVDGWERVRRKGTPEADGWEKMTDYEAHKFFKSQGYEKVGD
jgi:hypothetical protein